MKLTKIKKLMGMTLIELTVVILVLLTLISVLFIGAQAYKNAADKSACILNIRNLHQGMRAYQNTNALNVGESISPTDGWIGTNKFIEVLPTCPSQAAAYSLTAKVPPIGTPVATCGDTKYATEHKAKSYAGW